MRRADWEAALSGYLAAHRNASLDWAEMDCGKFAAGAVEAMTGENLLPKGEYATKMGATRVLKNAGFYSLKDFMDNTLPAVPKALARRGDIVMSDDCLGVCIGAEALFLPLEGSGLVRRHRRDWSDAWAVN